MKSGADLPKQWVLFKEFLPSKLLPTTCTPTPTISSTAFSLGIKALLCPSQKQKFLGSGNTFLVSVIYILVWRSQWQFLSCEQDLRTGKGERWGYCGCLMEGGAADGILRWVLETEAEAEALKTNHLLRKTPDFGTTVLGQFWAICREPGSLYTPCHLELLLFVPLGVYLWGGWEFEGSRNSSKYFQSQSTLKQGLFWLPSCSKGS